MYLFSPFWKIQTGGFVVALEFGSLVRYKIM